MMVTITSGGIDLAVGSLVGLAGYRRLYVKARDFLAGGCFGWNISLQSCRLISGLIIAKGRIFPICGYFWYA
jgi:ribose/xylose/arabinose/galactoside ABC-type transport system permease subunit